MNEYELLPEPPLEVLPMVRKLIRDARRLGPIPEYGSDGWVSLPEGDPRRLGAVFTAAECWRHDGRPEVIAARLIAEFAHQDTVIRRRMKLSSIDVSLAADWVALSRSPSFAELERRRNEVAA